MAQVTERHIPADQLDMLGAFVGASHDMLSFDASYKASSSHGAYLGVFRLMLPDGHYNGSEPFSGAAAVIDTEWHQHDSDDYHCFIVSRQDVEAQPVGEDAWVRPTRIAFGGEIARIEVFSARFTVEYLSDKPDVTFVYDKFLRFVSSDETALTLTTAHGSILGEIEVRAAHTFEANGEGPDAAPRKRVVLQ